MTTFDTAENPLFGTVDHATGNKVAKIIEKYLNKTMNQEMCDSIIQDLQEQFGVEHPSQVTLDDETNEILIIVRDHNGSWIKCSSLTLFPEKT
jgi:hypothetical protein